LAIGYMCYMQVGGGVVFANVT